MLRATCPPPRLDSDEGELTSSYSSSSSFSSVPARSSSSLSSSHDDPPRRLSSASCAASPLSPVVASSRKPHRSSSDPSWAAILRRRGPLGPRDFRLVRRIGSGDVGTVYLCHLVDDEEDDGGEGNRREARNHNPLLYAMKVVDRRELERKKKLGRAEAERRVLRSLDHPFLPTLYADFDAAHYSCVVMEFCPAGDLHSLRHLRPSKRFPLDAVRFYAAEVLLALEYLHMLGIVYRDLKPENVLIRPDGHIMLSDFDLSFESDASPVLDNDDDNLDDDNRQPSCLPTRLLSFMRKQRESKNRLGFLRRCSSSSAARPRFVAEPAAARSRSFVGTHEYVAPEVVSGRAHGGQVDWWAYGVFVYELLHGRTPFAGPTNEATLRNILEKPLAFPSSPGAPGQRPARDLIARLLAKDPRRRLGCAHGAADVKGHPFFRDVNFALLRTVRPPVVPGALPAAVEGAKKISNKNAVASARFDYF